MPSLLKSRCFQTFATFLCFFWSPLSFGVSLENLIQQAVENHPSVLECQQKIAVLQGQWTQAGLRPNPTLQYTAEEMGSGTMGRQGIEISQEIVTGGKLANARQLAAFDIQTATQELEVVRRKVETDIRLAVYDYLTAQKRLESLETICQICRTEYQLAEKKLSIGEMPAQKVLPLQIESQKAEAQRAAAKNDILSTWHILACALGNPDLSPVKIEADYDSDTAPLTWEAYRSAVLTNHPGILEAQGQLAAARQKFQLEQSRNSSNITVSGGISYASDEHQTQASVGLGIPLRVFDRNQGNISSAYADIQRATEALEKTELSIQNQLATSYREYANACILAVQYQNEILPNARKMMDLTQRGYQSASVDYLELLDSQRTYVTLMLSYIDTMGAYWRHKILLEGQLLSGSLD